MKPKQTPRRLKATDVDGKNGTGTGQYKKLRLAKSDVRYWQSKVTKRSYRTPEGTMIEIPEWQWRCRKGGDTWFNLGTANRESAATKAQEIALCVDAHGLDAAIEKYKRTEEKRDCTTIEEFCDLYREAAAGFSEPPRRPTVERYITNLKFICDWLKVTKIGDLNNDAVLRFKKGHAKKVAPSSVATRLREGAAVFSKRATAYYQSKKLTLTNPFAEHKFSVATVGYKPLDRAVIDKIWADSIILKTANPAAFAVLVMELGLGLRRNEADKAERAWFSESGGRRYLTIQKTAYFEPKSGRERTLPVHEHVFNALKEVMPEVGPFIVPGGLPPAKSRSKANLYRVDDAHRFLVEWLRERGVTGNRPCHQLRKEFGSEVASSFGLFAAQKLLGHQSPVLTAALYAGMKDLPVLTHAKL